MLRRLLTLCLLLAALPVLAQTLWYTRPATYFEEALPVGNGRIGAMVYGGTDCYRLSLNDLTLWTGEPLREAVNSTASAQLPLVEEALWREDYAAADTLVQRIQGKESEKYQPLGTLLIDFLCPDTSAAVSAYRRELCLDDASARSVYQQGGDTLRTLCCASAPDSCLVVRLSTSRKQGLHLRLRLLCALPHVVAVEDKKIVNRGYAAYAANAYQTTGRHEEQFFYDAQRGIHFCTIVALDAQEGSVVVDGESLVVSDCSVLTVYICNATSFNGALRDPVAEGAAYEDEAWRNIAHALAKGFDAVRRDQIADYQALFQRVHLSLGTTAAAIKSRPTDEQLRLYTAKKQKNPELEAAYFAFGRYLLIASSRTPEVPCNLQGLWNEHLSPPWRSNYTVNINLEENYWLAETANLSELHMPLLTFLRPLAITGRQTAQAYYGVGEGWCCGHNSDIWALTNPIGEGIANPQWANWTMGGAWLATHIYEHYLFTRDTLFLRSYYPLLREAARFCALWLVEKDSELIPPVSTSPENSYRTGDHYTGSTFYGGTADLAMTREVLAAACAAAAHLGVDSALQQSFAATLAALRPYHVGRHGQLLEWYYDWDDADWQHRHQSHLYGLYPGHHISPALTPSLAAAAVRTLQIKGLRTTGWSTAWRANLYARLHKSKEAYALLRTLLRYVSPEGYKGKDKAYGGGTYPNFFDAHPPFQIDGNFGGAAAMIEMLVQSTEESITLLPACPTAWSDGSADGLCTRGGGIITFAWHNGQVTTLTIHARCRLTTTVFVNGTTYAIDMAQGETLRLF